MQSTEVNARGRGITVAERQPDGRSGKDSSTADPPGLTRRGELHTARPSSGACTSESTETRRALTGRGNGLGRWRCRDTMQRLSPVYSWSISATILLQDFADVSTIT